MTEAEMVTWIDLQAVDGGKTDQTTFYLAGMRGTVQFQYMSYSLRGETKERATDLGYHSPRPLYEGQEPLGDHGQCHALKGSMRHGRCYYDGSALNADPIYEAFKVEGPEAVWRALKDYYLDVFYDGAWDSDLTGGDYLTPEERHHRWMESCRDILPHMPNEGMQKLVDEYFADK